MIRYLFAWAIEAMRYLKSGNHVVRIARKGGASLGRITVRAIPALQHAFYHTTPHIGAYGGTFYAEDRSREFAKAALAGGGYLCREHYLPEQPTREAAQQLLTRVLAGEAAEWEEVLPVRRNRSSPHSRSATRTFY
jgi:hypothetical protein